MRRRGWALCCNWHLELDLARVAPMSSRLSAADGPYTTVMIMLDNTHGAGGGGRME